MSQDPSIDERPSDPEEADPEALAAQVELLAEENRRLRSEYARARRVQYRRTALGFAVAGAVAALAGLAFPAVRAVLFSLGATGLFAALLTYYLTPEQLIPATVGERAYTALHTNGSAIIDALGLQDVSIYLPPDGSGDGVRLFVPQHSNYDLPPRDALEPPFVVPETEREWGLLLRPTGDPMFDEFTRALTGDLASDPVRLADQLTDGLVEQFELARSATPEIATDDTQATIGIAGSTYGAVDRFDHPLPSFLAVGFARGLNEPVTLDVTQATDDRIDYLVVCSWGER